MDLLSVLLHELGHLLGAGHLDASLNPSHYMAETLTPGQRRLPSEEDLDQLFASGDVLDALLGG